MKLTMLQLNKNSKMKLLIQLMTLSMKIIYSMMKTDAIYIEDNLFDNSNMTNIKVQQQI